MEKKTDFKALSSKAKVQYIWDYYRLHILSVIVIGGIVIGLTYHFVSYRKPILSVIMINVQTTSENADAAFDEFSDTAGYDKNSSPSTFQQTFSFRKVQMQLPLPVTKIIWCSPQWSEPVDRICFWNRGYLFRLCKRRCLLRSAHLYFR